MRKRTHKNESFSAPDDLSHCVTRHRLSTICIFSQTALLLLLLLPLLLLVMMASIRIPLRLLFPILLFSARFATPHFNVFEDSRSGLI